jgi:hypothetical protein
VKARIAVAGLVCVAATLAACSAATGPTPEVPAAELRQVPTSVTVGGATLVLEPYLWRDFQPISPPDGKPLAAVLRLRTSGDVALPAGVRVDAAWVVSGEAIWAARISDERLSTPPGPPFYEAVARDGPKWGPGITVDVVVQVRDADARSWRLRASGVPINRTD